MDAIPCIVLALAMLVGCSPERSGRSMSRSCSPNWKPEKGTTLVASLPTDSGMHGLWDPETFRTICDLETWEKNFNAEEGIARHIAAGAFVPIYVRSDGRPLIELRTGTTGALALYEPGPDVLVERRSRPYLFVSRGMVGISGIEYIAGSFNEGPRFLELAPGRWVVEVLQVEPRPGFDRELASKVPNFVVLVNPETGQKPQYSRSVETFE